MIRTNDLTNESEDLIRCTTTAQQNTRYYKLILMLYFAHSQIGDGEVMERPTTSQAELYDLMCDCWQFKPTNRPGFSACATTIEALYQMNKNYIRLDNFPENKYYHLTNVEGEIV